MTTRYVRISGSDSNNGTSAATAWRTFGKLLGAPGMVSGDTAYVGAGVYRETVTVGMTAPTAEAKIVGDVDGAQTGDAGEVVLTAYTTNDTTAPNAGVTLNLNSCPWLTFSRLTVVGGGTGAISASVAGATNITLRECAILATATSSGGAVLYQGAFNVAANWLIERCSILALNACVQVQLAQGTGADYSSAFTVQNCLLLPLNWAGVAIYSTGSGANLGGGVRVAGCTILSANNGVTTSGSLSTSTPCRVLGNALLCSSTALVAGASGQISEDYNVILGTATARSNVSIGTHSKSGSATAPLLDIGQSFLHLFPGRPFLTPVAGSPLLGFGDDGTMPSVDLLNRPRPAGGSASKAVGMLERHDTGTQASSPVHGTTTHSLQLAGPADHEFLLPVDAVAQTPSIWAQYDANYGGGTLPQAVLTNGGQIGVADQTLTMTAVGSGTWQQLTFSSFTPTAKGYVTIRLVSSAAATGNAYFGDFAP